MKIRKPSNQNGIAIILVMSAVLLMTILMTDFTYETELNKLRIYNAQDRAQAKLNAEAGLHFSLLKMRLFQNAINMLEKNKSISDVLSEDKIQGILTAPFVYPIPLEAAADITQRTAIEDFAKSVILEGAFQTSISPINGFYNPNLLRIPAKSLKDENYDEESVDAETQKNKEPLHVNVEQKLTELLERELQDKLDSEEGDRYANYDAALLVKELKFYVNDEHGFEDDRKAEVENIYSNAGITPKHAPLVSLDELYNLAGWTEDIIRLMEGKLNVHQSSVIGVNDLYDDGLKLLFPSIPDEDRKRFFEYRDGVVSTNVSDGNEYDQEPHPFKNVKEFKSALTQHLGLISSENYDDRIKELEKAGLHLGISSKLFKIVSTGVMNNAKVEITAIVEMPAKERITPKKASFKPVDEQKKESENSEGESENGEESENGKNMQKGEKAKDDGPKEYLPPRIVEIRIT